MSLTVRTIRPVYLAILALAAWTLALPAFPDTSAHPRVIHLKGSTNTRDIGGYPAGGERIFRWGTVYRSDNLAKLTEDDFRILEEIGVKTVIDLRTNREHEQSPTKWQGENPPQFYHFPIGDSRNDWFNAQRRMMQKRRFTEEEAREHMAAGFRMFAAAGSESFEGLMDVLLDPSSYPVLIHCTAGKDRAGVAVALIQEAVGVDRETIMQDFLLTNEVSRAEEKAQLLSRQRDETAGTRRIGKSPSAAAWFPIIGAQPEMLEAFYAGIEESYGSVDAFLTAIGVDSEARSALVASLTMDTSQISMSETPPASSGDRLDPKLPVSD